MHTFIANTAEEKKLVTSYPGRLYLVDVCPRKFWMILETSVLSYSTRSLCDGQTNNAQLRIAEPIALSDNTTMTFRLEIMLLRWRMRKGGQRHDDSIKRKRF